MNRIPLTVGVTGHIGLREADMDALYRAVKQELESLREACPHTQIKMINSLAAGADLLCAEAAEELGIPLIAALPLEAAEYRKDFGAETLAKLEHHLRRAETVLVIPAAERETGTENRDFWYRQAGIYVAEHSHILLALWDGKEPGELEAGTAATVKAALEGDWTPEKGMPVRSGENTGVIHILTPRGENAFAAGEVRRFGNAEAVKTVLERTEEFNRLAEGGVPEGEPLLPEEDLREPELRKLEKLYQAADGLSIRYARQYRAIMAGLALAGTVLTLAFLLYDNAELRVMILACGAALCAGWLLFRFSERSACHRRFIDYRALAEALRVQLFLRYAGSRLQAQRLMTWTQRQETAWILCALCAVNAAPLPKRKRDVLESWVTKQQDYHRSAGRRAATRLKKQNRILRCAMVASIALYFLLLVFELACGGLIFTPAWPPKDPETIRRVLKITLGTISAGTLFIAGYYGKMSLSRMAGDYEKMAAFYEKAAGRIARCGEDEQMLETLAREELTENGNWTSYQRDNAPEMNV